MIALAIALAATLTPADWYVERAMTVGACERFYAVDKASAEAQFDRELTALGFSRDSGAALRHARDTGRSLHIGDNECVEILALQARPSYMARYRITKGK